MTGIIIAAAVVSIVGLILGLFLGFMGKKFAVEVDQKEIDVRAELPGIIVADVDMRVVMHLQKLLLQEKLKLEHVLSVVNLLQRRLLQSWVQKSAIQRE